MKLAKIVNVTPAKTTLKYGRQKFYIDNRISHAIYREGFNHGICFTKLFIKNMIKDMKQKKNNEVNATLSKALKNINRIVNYNSVWDFTEKSDMKDQELDNLLERE